MLNERGLIAEQEALTRVAKELHGLLGPGDERAEYLGTVLAPVTSERVRAANPNGKYKMSDGQFNALPFTETLRDAVRDLRSATYREGAGTWFSAKVSVTAQGAVSAEYNYDDEPEWDAPVDAVAYLTDLERFPRDEANQPEWLKAKLAEGRAARRS